MRDGTRCVTNLERALARASYDAEFRLQVLEEGRAAQVAYRLAEGEWQVLVAAVRGLERAPRCPRRPGGVRCSVS